jgi:TonB-like protein
MALSAAPLVRGTYGLTIIAGGSSGGASRDLGVFSRSETVYTVFIPMTDAGGGPDWPMQYALSSAPASGGLLAPPIARKKIPATGSKTNGNETGPVFVTGTINEQGKLQGLRPIRALDASSRSAMNALAQWEFLPAELDGKPVASKVLIGVTVIPVEEAGK